MDVPQDVGQLASMQTLVQRSDWMASRPLESQPKCQMKLFDLAILSFLSESREEGFKERTKNKWRT